MGRHSRCVCGQVVLAGVGDGKDPSVQHRQQGSGQVQEGS
jgi:hypothetical protein